MFQDRVKQAIAIVIALFSITVGGLMLPKIIQEQEDNTLRYTNNVVEGAPDWINTIGMSIGALRGLLVDYLWIKICKKRGFTLKSWQTLI